MASSGRDPNNGLQAKTAGLPASPKAFWPECAQGLCEVGCTRARAEAGTGAPLFEEGPLGKTGFGEGDSFLSPPARGISSPTACGMRVFSEGDMHEGLHTARKG